MRVSAFIKKYIFEIFVFFVSLLYGIAGSLINVNRLWQYELGYYDFGIFARPIWLVSRFKPPIIDHFMFSNHLNFADHFNPSIFLFSPLFWITPHMEVLLIAESLLVGLSGYVLFFIGRKVLKSNFMAFAVVIAYLFFHGLQNAVYSDFHEVTAMTFFLMMTYWAIFNGKKKTYFLFYILTLGFKESIFLLGIGLAIFIFLVKKEWRRIAFFSFLIAIVWGYVAIKILIPSFSSLGYYYSPNINLKDFKAILTALVSPSLKLKTIGWTLLSFLFLPLLAPSIWPMAIVHYAQRFLLDSSTRWDLGLHYNAEIAPTLAIGSILGLAFIQKRIPRKLLYAIGFTLCSVSLFLHRFIWHGPLGLSYNPVFYKHTKDFTFLDNLVNKVPKKGRISAQNNLAPSFFHQDVWILRNNYRYMKPDYIVIDARDGQNPNNYLGVKNIKDLVAKIKKDSAYTVYYQSGDQYIFKKIRNYTKEE